MLQEKLNPDVLKVGLVVTHYADNDTTAIARE